MKTFVAVASLLGALLGPVVLMADDEEEEGLPVYRSGLYAIYSQTGRPLVRRIDDDLQFVWRPGTAPDERLSTGPFQVVWQGRLHSLAGGEYRLQLFVEGAAEISLNGKQILRVDSPTPGWHESEPVQLTYGHHKLVVSYRRTQSSGTIKLHWSGPQFGVEPVPERNLFHDPTHSVQTTFADGRQLVRALRCAACHDLPDESPLLPAPALTHLDGNLSSAWLVDWLSAKPAAPTKPTDALRRRMPHQSLSRDDAAAIAAYLFEASQPPTNVKVPQAKEPSPIDSAAPSSNTDPKKKPKPRTEPSVRAGEQLAASLGCIACHRIGQLGSDALFGGTDLTQVAAKRPAEFFVRWFDDAAKVNADHRMPQFQLNPLERADLTAYLATLGGSSATKNVIGSPRPGTGRGAGGEGLSRTPELTARGKQLVVEHRCAACHKLPGESVTALRAQPLNAMSKWDDGCLGEPLPQTTVGPDQTQTGPKRPGYLLDEWRRAAIVEYLSAARPVVAAPADAAPHPRLDDGAFVLVERNCVGCHARGLGVGLGDRVAAVTAAHPELAAVQAALLPPSLNGIGDKLPDEAFLAAVKTARPPLRPWLRVRMPKFDLSESETAALQHYLIDHDRIPERPPSNEPSATPPADDVAQRLAARRLVTADGFGCTSCHKIGDAVPAGTISLAAMGTDLSMVGERLRKPWFDRWVRNPARIVPRMEMPAVQRAVFGVLHDDLDQQLAAVWQVLNEPGFTPPLPNPVRVVRARNVPGLKEPPHVLTDLFVVDGHTYVSPIVIGLPNRHNLLFDLEHNRLAAWWTGDTALLRTKGKGWFWEPGGTSLFPKTEGAPHHKDSELAVIHENINLAEVFQIREGQGLCVLQEILHIPRGVMFKYRIMGPRERGGYYDAYQTFTQLPDDPDAPQRSGFRRRVVVADFVSRISASLIPSPVDTKLIEKQGDEYIFRGVDGRARMAMQKPNDRPDIPFYEFIVDYMVDLPIDTFPNDLPPLPNPPAVKMDVVPGYEAVRLPLPAGEMPTGLAWKPDGTLLVASLKGRILAAVDTDGDGLEDRMTPVSDDLATPYGLHVARQDGRDVIDVITKPALVRLHDVDGDGFYEKQEIAADGWGHTDDYHDWAVGLPKIRTADGDDAGGYYVALPCQQDDRDPVKARLRGQGLRLVPREPTKDDSRRFAVEPFCGGLRFPMGLAVDRAGRLFATDNQGHYNPFNELNHLVPGKRYGYLNKLERRPDFNPPTESPAVEIPHPWTRSVNGICFLESPPGSRTSSSALDKNHFGPFEGHLLGCEFNGRSLVRMSLEEVDGVMQGAVYPFSQTPADLAAPNFEGPNVVAVAPDGDIYVGNLLDSGWGGGQNTGSIVRLRPQDELPPGIAEVRAASDGFVVRFTHPIDRAAAAKPANYPIEAYRRIATPQYGGDDVDRGPVRVTSAEPSDDGREVRLRVEPLRAGFVYEFHLTNLTPAGRLFFPAEAHYTLKRLPR